MTTLEIIGTTVLVVITLFVMWVLWIALTAFIPAFIKAFRKGCKELKEKNKEN